MKLKIFIQTFGVLLIVLSVTFLGWVATRTIRQMRTGSWPSVQGTVLSVNYFEFGTRRSERGAAKLAMSCQYSVDGEKHISDNMTLGTVELKGDAEKLSVFANSHPVGSNVEVFYNPTSPMEAVVFRGANWMVTIANTALGFLALLTGYILATRNSSRLSKRIELPGRNT